MWRGGCIELTFFFCALFLSGSRVDARGAWLAVGSGRLLRLRLLRRGVPRTPPLPRAHPVRLDSDAWSC